jgi:hypothetical protein
MRQKSGVISIVALLSLLVVAVMVMVIIISWVWLDWGFRPWDGYL